MPGLTDDINPNYPVLVYVSTLLTSTFVFTFLLMSPTGIIDFLSSFGIILVINLIVSFPSMIVVGYATFFVAKAVLQVNILKWLIFGLTIVSILLTVMVCLDILLLLGKISIWIILTYIGVAGMYVFLFRLIEKHHESTRE